MPPYYHHRRYWGVTSFLLLGALLAGTVISLWDASLSEWVANWPGHLIMLTVWAWWWFMVVRHISREVVVDEDGLWIDGAWQVGGADIVAVGVVDHVTYDSRLRRIDEPGRRAGFVRSHLGAGAWSQSAWARVLDVEGVGPAVVTREHDLGRGSGWPGVLVVSRRSADGAGRGMRKAWIIGTYRGMGLVTALARIAPEEALLRDPDPTDVRGPI